VLQQTYRPTPRKKRLSYTYLHLANLGLPASIGVWSYLPICASLANLAIRGRQKAYISLEVVFTFPSLQSVLDLAMPQISDTSASLIINNHDGAKHFLKRFSRDTNTSLSKYNTEQPTTIFALAPTQKSDCTNQRQGRCLRQPPSELDITSQRLTSFTADLPAMDGSTERQPKKRSNQKAPVVAAIFVHAGAGYHSTTNEHLHLEACSK